MAAALANLLEGDADRAAADLAVAKRLFQSEGNAAWIAEADLLTALAAESLGDLDRARRLAHQAQEVFLRDGRAARVGSTDLLLARLDLAAGQPARALSKVARADERTRRVDAPWLRVELRRARGLALLALGETAAAADLLCEAVAALEAHRGGLPADEFMVAFLSSKAAIYAEAIEALVGCGRERDAFEFSERAKSRALVDMLAARDSSSGVTLRGDRVRLPVRRLSHQREKLNDVYARLHRAAAGLEPLPPEREEALRQTAADAEHAIAGLLRTEWARDPELLSLTTVSTFGLERVQALLDADTTLVEYFLTPDRLYAFVVGRDSFACRVIDVAETSLRRLIQRFRFHLAKFNLHPDERRGTGDLHLDATRANLAALALVLLEPVLPNITGRRLVVVPHGILHGVPIHALPLGEGWVADHWQVWYAPSATVFGFCAAKGDRASGPVGVVACADAAAPGIDAEAAAIGRACGDDAVVHTGAAATAAALRSAASSSRALHVAAHGMFRADRPLLSSLRLADTWLNAYDVYDLDVRAEMVTLAACESGVAKITDGDESLGLVRGFLFAGAPRLLVSNWRVHDETTALFMETLYASHRELGSWEQASAAAMRAVRKSHPHPYHWAPFFLVGYPQPTRKHGDRPARRPRAGADSRGGSCR